MPLLGIDNLPGSEPLETTRLPGACASSSARRARAVAGGARRLRRHLLDRPVRLDALDQRQRGRRDRHARLGADARGTAPVFGTVTGRCRAPTLGRMDLTHAESVHVAADPEVVWRLVTDIERTGDWSPICTGCEWVGDAPGPEGPRAGDRFVGHNSTPERSWDTTSEVVDAEPRTGVRLGGQRRAVEWGYRLRPVDGGTELTEHWELRAEGGQFFHEKFGEQGDQAVATRARWAREGIPATLATLKRLAEADQSGS